MPLDPHPCRVDLDAEFPLDSALVYLNHAAVSPWPRRAADAVARFVQENLHQGSRHYPEWLEVERRLRERLAWLIGARSEDIALLKNTSEALSVVAYGIDWQPGDNVLIPANEFPSNRIVWESLARFGVECRQVSVDDQRPEAALIEAIDERTRLLAVSSVHFATGLRLDCAQLGSACRERGVLFCIDAIQSLGAAQLDVVSTQADFICADGHKWLFGPEGLALFYSRPEARSQLKLHQYGWHMVEAVGDFTRSDWQVAEGARRFECGSPNMLAIHALEAALSLFEAVGLEEAQARVTRRSAYLMEAIHAIGEGYSLITPNTHGRYAGIVTLTPRHETSESLHAALLTAGVQCMVRGGGVRLAPHLYTREEDLARVVRLLTDRDRTLTS